jgi:hypothetical protein
VEDAIDAISRRARILLEEESLMNPEKYGRRSMLKGKNSPLERVLDSMSQELNGFMIDLKSDSDVHHNGGSGNVQRYRRGLKNHSDVNPTLTSVENATEHFFSQDAAFDRDYSYTQTCQDHSLTFHPNLTMDLTMGYSRNSPSPTEHLNTGHGHRISVSLSQETDTVRLLETVSTLTNLLRAMRHRIAFLTWALHAFRLRPSPARRPSKSSQASPISLPLRHNPLQDEDTDFVCRPREPIDHAAQTPHAAPPTASVHRFEKQHQQNQKQQEQQQQATESCLREERTGAHSEPFLSQLYQRRVEEAPQRPPPPLPGGCLPQPMQGSLLKQQQQQQQQQQQPSDMLDFGSRPHARPPPSPPPLCHAADGWTAEAAAAAAAAGLEAARERVRRFVEEEAARVLAQAPSHLPALPPGETGPQPTSPQTTWQT